MKWTRILLIAFLSWLVFLIVFLWAVSWAQSRYRAIEVRPFSELENARMFLFAELGYNYKSFRLLDRIFICESRWKFNAENRKTGDYGIAQINKLHIPIAFAQGLDVVNSYEDNIRYAVRLYDEQGTRPWNASRACWKR